MLKGLDFTVPLGAMNYRWGMGLKLSYFNPLISSARFDGLADVYARVDYFRCRKIRSESSPGGADRRQVCGGIRQHMLFAWCSHG